jgi:hypothetical protein
LYSSSNCSGLGFVVENLPKADSGVAWIGSTPVFATFGGCGIAPTPVPAGFGAFATSFHTKPFLTFCFCVSTS